MQLRVFLRRGAALPAGAIVAALLVSASGIARSVLPDGADSVVADAESIHVEAETSEPTFDQSPAEELDRDDVQVQSSEDA